MPGCHSGEIGSGGAGDSRWGDAGQPGRALPAESAGAQAGGRLAEGQAGLRCEVQGGLGQFNATENTLFRRNASWQTLDFVENKQVETNHGGIFEVRRE